MPKRSREDVQADLPPAKRTPGNAGFSDRLSSLSNELLLQILSFLPIQSLNVCQRYASVRCMDACSPIDSSWQIIPSILFPWRRLRALETTVPLPVGAPPCPSSRPCSALESFVQDSIFTQGLHVARSWTSGRQGRVHQLEKTIPPTA